MPLNTPRTGSNLAGGNFVPKLFSAKAQEKFYAASVVPAIANHDWEGELKGYGDEVTIRKVSTIDVFDVTIGKDFAYQSIADDAISFKIDRAKGYAYSVSDVDAHQSDINIISMFANDAAMQMAVSIDKTVLQSVYADAGQVVGASGLGDSTAINLSGLTAATYFEPLLIAGQGLDERNVPRDGRRWAVISPKYARLLKLSDMKSVQISGDAVSSVRNGFVGEYDGMNVYVSNNLLNAIGATGGAPTEMLVGHVSAISFASQFVQHQKVMREYQFAEGYRGQNVFGFKVTKDDSLIRLRGY